MNAGVLWKLIPPLLAASLLLACLPEPVDNAPLAPARIAMTKTVALGGLSDRFHLWYLSSGGELFMFEGGYDQMLGTSLRQAASPVVTRDGPTGAHFNPWGLAAVSYIAEVAGSWISSERVYIVGTDDQLYGFDMRSDRAWTIWRKGIETSQYRAAGPVAAMIVQTGGQPESAIVFVDADGYPHGCRQTNLLPDPPADLYAFNCAPIPGATPLDTAADIAAMHVGDALPGGTPPGVALFAALTSSGQFAGIWWDGFSWHFRLLGAPSRGLGRALAGVMTAEDPGASTAAIFGVTEETAGGRHVPILLSWSEPWDSSSAVWKPVSYAPELPSASPLRGELSAAWSGSAYGAPGTEVSLAALPERPSGVAATRMLIGRGDWVLPDAPSSFSWTPNDGPSDAMGLTGVLLREYLPLFSEGGAALDFTYSVGRLGAMGYVFLWEHRLDPLTMREWHEWRNLGSAQAKMLEATGLTSPHSEIFLAEYDASNPAYRGRMLAAGIVRDNPFYVTISYSVDDGLRWETMDELLGAAPQILPNETLLQTDPTVAFDHKGRGYVMVVAGINAPGTRVCSPGSGLGYMSRFGIYFVQYTYGADGSLATAGPYFVAHHGFYPLGLLDHPWLAADNSVAGAPTKFYAAWWDNTTTYVTRFLEDDWETWAGAPPAYRLVDPLGHPFTAPPVVLVGADGAAYIADAGQRLCELEPFPTGDDWRCARYQDVDNAVGLSTNDSAMRFRYADPVYSSYGDLVDTAELDNMQGSEVAVSLRDADEVFYVTNVAGPGCGYEAGSFKQVYFVRGTRSSDGSKWDWSSPLRVSPPRGPGNCGHDFDPDVATTEDGTVFVWWRALEGEHDAPDGVFLDPDLVQYAAILRAQTPSGSDYQVATVARVSDVSGRVQNLPVHCGRGSDGMPRHFAGEYDAYRGGRTHVHVPFSVPRWTGGWYTSQMFHSVVTPYNW